MLLNRKNWKHICGINIYEFCHSIHKQKRLKKLRQKQHALYRPASHHVMKALPRTSTFFPRVFSVLMLNVCIVNLLI